MNQAALFEPLDGAALSPPPPCCLCMREQCVCVRERERERERERKKERKKDHNPRNASIYTGECWCLPRLDTATRVSRIKNPFTNQFTLLPLLSPNSPYIFFVQMLYETHGDKVPMRTLLRDTGGPYKGSGKGTFSLCHLFLNPPTVLYLLSAIRFRAMPSEKGRSR